MKERKLGFYQISLTPCAEEITKFYTREYKNFNDSSPEVTAQDKYFLG